MQVINSLDQIPTIKNLVLTIGTFDGVHLGHQQLINRIKAKAKHIDGSTGLMTFHPHPRMILNPGDKSLKLLTSIEERAKLLESKGLDYLFIVPFSAEFSAMSAEAYVREFLIGKFRPRCLVIGYDHQFGKGRAGNVSLLNEMSTTLEYEVDQVGEQMVNDITLSSTKIRNLLDNGEVEKANKLLGYKYSFESYVVHGDKRGREIGFPTANLQPLDDLKLIPCNGVYAVNVLVDNKTYLGMMNIGTRPTFDGKTKSIEVHILDFADDIYGKKIVSTFVRFVRKERQFRNSEELITQLENDRTTIREIFNGLKNKT